MKNYRLLHWTPEMVKAFWDYESAFPKNFFTHKRGHEIIRQIRQYLPSGCSVLDYGCGPGNLIKPLLDAGFTVAGLDSSPSARDAVRTRYSDHSRFTGVYSQKEIDQSGLKFDAIIVAEVIEHLYDDQLDGLLMTLKTLSHEGTHIVFTTPNEERLEDSYILCPVSGELFHRWQHVRNWSANSVSAYLANRGYGAIKTFTTDFDATVTMRGKHHPLRPRWWSALRSRLRYGIQRQRKRPHLVIICQPNLG
jgi:2-polyprenyl-3-methyl-5-hydroxy-6-metoxy-1,4-benzoquinol methylase